MERYFTQEDVGFSDHLCEAALRNIMRSTHRHCRARKLWCPGYVWAGTIAHNDLLGMGRSEIRLHNIEHELSALYIVIARFIHRLSCLDEVCV